MCNSDGADYQHSTARTTEEPRHYWAQPETESGAPRDSGLWACFPSAFSGLSLIPRRCAPSSRFEKHSKDV
jgi:hypothetical protein